MRKVFLLLILIVCFFISIEVKRYQRSVEVLNKKVSRDNNQHKDTNKNAKSDKKGKGTKRKNKAKNNSFQNQNHEHQYLHWNQPAFWWHTLLAIFLSCAGGFFSGMTVGLNSLDKLQLQVQQITGNKQEKKIASRILNTIKDHHLFLVALLIGNAIVLSWLPLVVHKIMPDWAAILTSTVAVVIVAEIVPMSYTTGPNKYEIAYIGSPLVDFCTKIFYFIAYPVARGLDALLGVHDSSKIQRRDFLAFINNKKKNYLQPLQITMFNQLFICPSVTTVKHIMTSINDNFFLAQDEEINQDFIRHLQQSQIQIVFIVQSKIHKEGNIKLSRPVKVKQIVLNYLKITFKQKVKRKLKLNQILKEKSKFNNNLKSYQPKIIERIQIPIIYSDTGLLDANLILRQTQSSFAFVHKNERLKEGTNIAFLDANDFQVSHSLYDIKGSQQIIGIVTLNDIFEAISDFKGNLTSVLSECKENQQTPEAPKKRKLVKKASIISAYSSYSREE